MKDDAWIQTYTGRRVYPWNPTPESIVIDDIAHALSMIPRFGGHTKQSLSIAEHSVYVARRVEENGGSPMAVFGALLHDGSEAYIGDMVSPVKAFLPDFVEAEDALTDIIHYKFAISLTPEDAEIIKRYDTEAAFVEGRTLLLNPEVIADWNIFPTTSRCARGKLCGVYGLPQHLAKRLFLTEFYRTRGKMLNA